MKKMNWPLEILKYLYAVSIAMLIVIGASICVDAFVWLIAGWDHFPGGWPAFTTTMSLFHSPSATGSSPGAVVSVFVGFGALVRIIMGSYTPGFLRGLEKPSA